MQCWAMGRGRADRSHLFWSMQRWRLGRGGSDRSHVFWFMLSWLLVCSWLDERYTESLCSGFVRLYRRSGRGDLFWAVQCWAMGRGGSDYSSMFRRM